MARPLGSINVPKLRDFISVKDKQGLTDKALKLALEGDPTLLKFLLEQIYGKAVQPISGDGEREPINIQIEDLRTLSNDQLYKIIGEAGISQERVSQT